MDTAASLTGVEVTTPPKKYLIGYARVSTHEQDLDDQIARLKEVGCRKIFSEKITAQIKTKRPELETAIAYAREGDVLVVTSLDRMARSIRDLLNWADTLNHAGAQFRSLREGWADTSTPVGTFLLTVLGGVAEFERTLTVERTRRGREAARARGATVGVAIALGPEKIAIARAKLEEGYGVKQVAKFLGVARVTLWRDLKRDALTNPGQLSPQRRPGRPRKRMKIFTDVPLVPLHDEVKLQQQGVM